MLPNLPKQNKKKEASFGITLRRWIENNDIDTDNCSIEVKHTRGQKTFRLAEWKDKQRAYANMIQSDKGVLIRVDGTNGEPDYIFLRKSTAYVVIRYPKNFYIIPAIRLLQETTPSLSEQRASELSTRK